MTEHTVALTVAAYDSHVAARRDFEAIGRARELRRVPQVAAAVLDKGTDGTLTIDRADGVEPDVAWGGALLGAALTVLAAPVGIDFLPPVVDAPAGWARVAALVAHYWQHVPQETLRRMSDLLESRPVGLVVVTIDAASDDIGQLLSGAGTTIAADSTTVALDADLAASIDDPPPT